MIDPDDFEAVFGSNPTVAYDEETRRKIHHHRQALEKELFIDRLLKALGIADGLFSKIPFVRHSLTIYFYQPQKRILLDRIRI